MSFGLVMGLLCVCCVLLLVGFSSREKRWGPWLMLATAVGILLLMASSILQLIAGA